MAFSPRPCKRRAKCLPPPERRGQPRGITAQQVRSQAQRLLAQQISLPRPPDARYRPEDLWAVALYAAAHRTTLEQAAWALPRAPHPNTVRGALAQKPLEEGERECNQALAATLPPKLLRRPLEVACDLKLIPYHGQPRPGEEDFIVTSEARQGTNRFFAYASLYVIKHNRRFTLALRAVRRSEGLVGVLQWLLRRFAALGGELTCLYLDRQFYSVEVLEYLIEVWNIPFVLSAPKKGQRRGIAALVREKGPGVHGYTVRSPQHGEITVSVVVVGKYYQGRWQKHGRERYAFVVHRFPFAREGLWEKYRHRFGIESRHRGWEQARARTASQRVGLRWLLVGVAALLCNLWVWLQWERVSVPRRGGRWVLHAWFTLFRMLRFLGRALEGVYGVVEEVLVSTGDHG